MLHCMVSGEVCWWTVHPASKQRSEGEKVRVGDDLILVSVSSERYLVSGSFIRLSVDLQCLPLILLSLVNMSKETYIKCLYCLSLSFPQYINTVKTYLLIMSDYVNKVTL